MLKFIECSLLRIETGKTRLLAAVELRTHCNHFSDPELIG